MDHREQMEYLQDLDLQDKALPKKAYSLLTDMFNDRNPKVLNVNDLPAMRMDTKNPWGKEYVLSITGCPGMWSIGIRMNLIAVGIDDPQYGFLDDSGEQYFGAVPCFARPAYYLQMYHDLDDRYGIYFHPSDLRNESCLRLLIANFADEDGIINALDVPSILDGCFQNKGWNRILPVLRFIEEERMFYMELVRTQNLMIPFNFFKALDTSLTPSAISDAMEFWDERLERQFFEV